jgi:Pyruvate/2-oxoacid:ferredoxin oxidoreductase delta subunit
MNESPYIEIATKLDKMAFTAPRSPSGEGFSEAFLDYLKVIYTPEQAMIAQHLNVPIDMANTTFNAEVFMTPTQLAEVSGRPIWEVNRVLKQMSEKKTVLDIRKVIMASPITWPVRTINVLRIIYKGKGEGLNEVLRILKTFIPVVLENAIKYGLKSGYEFLSMKLYALPHIPLMININNYDFKIHPGESKAFELYKKFFVDEKWSRFYQSSAKGSSVMRTIPISKSLAPQEKILDTEEAHKIIDSAGNIVLAPCACRVRTEKLGTRKCKDRNPVGTCIYFGLSAQAFEGLGWGYKASKQQAKDHLDEMIEKGLVAITHNTEHPTSSLICLCCECCCGQTRGRIAWGNPNSIAPSNFFPKTDRKICTFCGTCQDRCMFHAITVDKEKKKWRLNPELCVGCGVCAVGCQQGAVKLHRAERSTPFKTPQDLYRQIDMENHEI